MKLAIMQPYFFPYIGYFQLIHTVDKFIFYDDVYFIKNGWVNRNRIIINNSIKYITVTLQGASPNRRINEINIIDNKKLLYKTIQRAYKRAPYFSNVWPIIQECLEYDTNKISELAMVSVQMICDYLGIKTQFEVSSEKYSSTQNLKGEQRILEICKKNHTDKYINAIGGTSLYSKQMFLENGIDLKFIKSDDIIYKQFDDVFLPNLSIIDALMFNPAEIVMGFIKHYKLD